MFGWLFKPKCPCDPAAKVWIEYRLRWLSEQFPRSAFTTGGELILPTPEFFPERYDASERAVRTLMGRVCSYMGVDETSIQLKFMENENRLGLVNESGEALPDAAGTFQGGLRKHVITLDRAEFTDSENLIGTMAHELAHVRLLGEGRLSGDVFDNELLTDLTTVHFGLGLFLANSPRDWMSGYTQWPGSHLKKPEYMNRPMYGWALALLAHFRDESKPKWTKHLSRVARLEVEEGLRYLEATRDSSYLPRGGELLN
jgi:hypothetical protein